MKKILFTILPLFLSVCLFAQTEKEKIWNTLLQFEKALVEKDSVQLKALLVNDFIGAIPTGRSFTKDAYIRHHCQPGMGLMNLNAGDMSTASIRIYNNTAIINRSVSVKRKEPSGTVVDVVVQRIEVFLKENGTWKIAAGQGTQVVNAPVNKEK